jgi:uncharacterized protein (TIGR02145 family)
MNFKNNITTLIFMMFCSLASMAQVGIGTTTPNSNAALDVVSTSQGMLYPRMTTAQRNAIASPATGLTIFNTDVNYIQTNTSATSTANWVKWAAVDPSSNGTAIVSVYTCNTSSAGILKVGTPVSGVTQTITATVGTAGTYNISTTTANGVTFAGSGTFAGTGARDIVLTATGTTTAKGSNTYTLNTTPNCNFSRYASITGCYANVGGTFKDFLCYNLGVTGTQDPLTYQSGNNNGTLYQWGRQTDGHEVRTSTTQAGPVAAPVANRFITVSNVDWLNPANNSLWGDGTAGADPAKTANDPCPTGFKIPSQAQWGGLFRTGITSGAPGTANQNTWTWTTSGFMVGSNLFLPAAGYRNGSNATLTNVGTNAYYSSSNVNGTNTYNLSFSSGTVSPGNFNERALALSVRCIEVDNPSSNGTAVVSAYTCNTASAGTMTTGIAVSGVSQTITATVTTAGTYGITATANGVTFTATGTFSATGAQTVVLTATGTPTAAGSNSFTLNTSPNCSFSRTTLSPLPANITLSAISPYFVASVYDQDYLPYTAPTVAASLATAQAANGTNETTTLNIQGALTTTGVTIKIPYTVVTAAVSLPAFSQTINVPASYTEDGISRDVTFSYSAASLGVGSGTINASLQAGVGTLNAKKLDIQTGIGNDNLGFLLAQFTYATNSSGGIANFAFRDIAPIPDRNIADANHVMFYLPVIGADGRTWLNNNLGANYANTTNGAFNPAAQATSSTDANAYGSLFQWGRGADGHELMNWSSGSTGTAVNAATSGTSTSTTPGNSFLSGLTNWYTGTNPTPASLWQGVNGTNNPCPIGFRLPTETELNNQILSWSANTSAGALASPLKLPMTGLRNRSNGSLIFVGSSGSYQSSTVSGTNALFLSFSSSNAIISFDSRAYGFSVRCIGVEDLSTNGTAAVSAYTCNTASAGTMTAGTAVSGVTQTITATVTTVGTYSISTTTANGVTFTGSGTFSATGAQTVVLTATGTPTAIGTHTFTLNTTPNCNFIRTTTSYANTGSTYTTHYNGIVSGVHNTTNSSDVTYYTRSTYTTGETFNNNATCSSKPISVSVCGASSITVGSNTYSIANINGQCWMTQNLKEIPSNYSIASGGIGSGAAWTTNSPGNVGYWGYYNTSTTNGTLGWGSTEPAAGEGLQYQWSAAMNGANVERAQGVCPTGWHIPSDCEWMYLEHGQGMALASQDSTGWRSDANNTQGTPGYKLRSAGTGQTNASGFSGLLVGNRETNGVFNTRGAHVYWWTSTSGKNTRNVSDNDKGVNRSNYSNASGQSVRCLKD